MLSPKHTIASASGGGGGRGVGTASSRSPHHSSVSREGETRRLPAEAQPFFVRSPPSAAAEQLEQEIEARRDVVAPKIEARRDDFQAEGGWNAIWQAEETDVPMVVSTANCD